MTADRFKPLLDREFLKAELHYEYEDWLATCIPSSPSKARAKGAIAAKPISP